jgi:hypothetical protein
MVGRVPRPVFLRIGMMYYHYTPHRTRVAEKYNFVLMGIGGLKSTKKYKKFP